MSEVKKTGILIGDDGNPIQGASGVLVDGAKQTFEKADEAAKGITEATKNTVKDVAAKMSAGAANLSQDVKRDIGSIPNPKDVPKGETVNPDDVATGAQEVQNALANANAQADPTDWKAKYDELSKQMEDLQSKYAKRFSGQDLSPVQQSSDVAQAVNVTNKIEHGDDLDIDDLFKDVTGYEAGKTKSAIQNTFSTDASKLSQRESTIPTEGIGYKIGSGIREGTGSAAKKVKDTFSSLFEDVKERR